MELNLDKMTERDLLVTLVTKVSHLEDTMSDNQKRLTKVEVDFLTFKTEINTRLKMSIAIASTIATGVGSLLTTLFNHFTH